MNIITLLLPILIPVLAGAFLLIRRPDRSETISLLVAIVTGVTLLGVPGYRFELAFSDTLSFLLEPDGFSMFFTVIMVTAFACAILYSREYLAGDERRPIFFGFTLLTLGALMGLSLAGNIVTFYFFFECMSILSFPLVLYNGGEKARSAAMCYLGFSVFGASLALMGMLMGGTITLVPFAAPVEAMELPLNLQWAWLLMALGFSCKAGMMPLANWLPTAHPVAPAPASALLSGIITKAGILGMLRSTFHLFGAENLAGSFAQTVMLALAIVTIFTGSMLAYKEKLLKKRLAYSSVSQLSYVIFGLMLLTPAGLEGGLMQVLFHACAKVGLFLCAGAFIHHAEANYVDELVGIGRKMPGVLTAFACFSLSLVGLPPFGGLVSKDLLVAAAQGQGCKLAQLGIVVLLISALLTAGYLLPIVARGFFPGADCKIKKHDAGWPMLVPLFVLAAVAVVLGLWPEPVAHFLHGAMAGLF